jgi:imidazolonepropionase-like amidohydrolase
VAQANPEIPGKPQTEPIALVGGTIHVVSGPAIENGTILFDQGKITAVGKEVAIPKDAEVIDVAGRHVYPGLIHAYSGIGLVEIDGVRATKDFIEVGRINPNVKAQVAFNPDSELIPVARASGVLLALSVPQGGLLAGQSALMMLDGWTYEDMTLKAPVAIHVNWPHLTASAARWQDDESEGPLPDRNELLEELRKTFRDARAYHQAKSARAKQPQDLRLEALGPVLERRTPLFVLADEVRQIQSAVAFAEREKLRLAIVGGYDALRCVELLKKHDVPVIISRVPRLPMRRGDAYDDPFTLPERLRQAGIKFCIAGADRFQASSVGNLPYGAGMAAAHGLPRDIALRSVTLSVAEIFGVADRVGSLDRGKDATLLVADGDLLETPTRVERAFIQGRDVDLSNRHKRLWRKYQEKQRRIEAATR